MHPPSPYSVSIWFTPRVHCNAYDIRSTCLVERTRYFIGVRDATVFRQRSVSAARTSSAFRLDWCYDSCSSTYTEQRYRGSEPDRRLEVTTRTPTTVCIAPYLTVVIRRYLFLFLSRGFPKLFERSIK